MNLAGKNILMVVAPEDFRDEEYFVPKDFLEANRATIITASTLPEAKSKKGVMVKVDKMIGEVDDREHDALIFVGGSGAETLFSMIRAHMIAEAMHENGKLIGAICAAPTILARAGLLEGKPATCFPSQRDELKRHGAILKEEDVVITKDGIITANGVAASLAFAKAFAQQLIGVKAA